MISDASSAIDRVFYFANVCLNQEYRTITRNNVRNELFWNDDDDVTDDTYAIVHERDCLQFSLAVNQREVQRLFPGIYGDQKLCFTFRVHDPNDVPRVLRYFPGS